MTAGRRPIRFSDGSNVLSVLKDEEPSPLAEAARRWEFANDKATEQAGALAGAIDFAHDQANSGRPRFDAEGKS